MIPPTPENHGGDNGNGNGIGPVVSCKEHEMEIDFMNDKGVL